MHINKVTGLLVLLCCELCLTIKVPTVWTESGNSAVNNQPSQVEIVQPQNVRTLHQLQPIPIDYFQYTAQKPQFAVDIAAFHGVNNPQEHYKAYPIKPFALQQKPVLGVHQILNPQQNTNQPYQKYVQKTENSKDHVQPVSTGYEIFHPYGAEQSALQKLYNDPTLTKMRNDLKDANNRFQAYVQETGRPNIADDEYLEGQQKTDQKLFPQKNIPAKYEIHNAERRPIYYKRPPAETKRDQVLNKKLKHPWNQQNIKITPLHYKPIKNHIQSLRQQQAMKYDDERNEYPQVIADENTAEQEDGQDIYENGKQKYSQLKNNLDLSINKAIQANRPVVYENLELQKNDAEPKDVDKDENEFIPIKNYAQVRKSETFRHVPRNSAYDDAETLEEILNAPRLREAVKSSKAQIVYSEEGYEDSAYDHAGEQKHASDHERHGGLLKQKGTSAGLYKTPKVHDSYQDDRESEYRDNIEHAEKWKNNNKDQEEESEAEDYSREEYDESVDANIDSKKYPKINNRNKREHFKILRAHDSDYNFTNYNENRQNTNDTEHDDNHDVNIQHELDKREVNIEVPEINLDSTFLSDQDIAKLPKGKVAPLKDIIKNKYPYYYKKIKEINKNSPLRYAENLNYIPKKSEGGTEFYDSRSNVECPEVDSDVDPIPQKLQNGENPTDEENEEESESNDNNEKGFDKINKQPRLNGLGDKIDCFKAKYFGENPLDSPFFEEEIIASPEPIEVPNFPIYKELNIKEEDITDKSKLEKDNIVINTDLYDLLDKLRINTKKSDMSLNESNTDFQPETIPPKSSSAIDITQQSDVYADILTNINDSLYSTNKQKVPTTIDSTSNLTKLTYNFYKNKEEVTKLPQTLRKKRSTSFIYEPYKIIKDSQLHDSIKTTTTGNISPLIKQLQSSRVVDRVSRSNGDDRQARPGVSSRSYVDIGRKERDKYISDPTIIDVNIDQRRGEPRYEVRPRNHKTEYTPVEIKKNMSLEDYKSVTGVDDSPTSTKTKQENINKETRNGLRKRLKASFLTSPTDTQNTAESNAVKKTVTTSNPHIDSKNHQHNKEISNEDSLEDYDDEDEEDEEDEESDIGITTSTTVKPRRKVKDSSTTENSRLINEDEPEKLRLITLFRNYKPNQNPKKEVKVEVTDPPTGKQYEHDISMPKYREKKKKSTKSTLVTDTQKYGDDDGEVDIKKEEVDALIGVQQNMDEYTPLYEKEEQKRHQSETSNERHNRHKNNENSEDDIDEDDDDDSDDGDDDDDVEDDGDDDAEDEEFEEDDEEDDEKPIVTTTEPTKRTLVRTTDAPSPTVASYRRTTATPSLSNDEKSDLKPVVTRKQIEIHEELPANKSSPHVTQFKQDIKEVEIIKESPVVDKRKPTREGEVLELYKDDNLAKEINKLGDVEIFNENIDIDGGRKHGGNYRKATKEDLRLLQPRVQESVKPPKDTEASQTENQKHVEFDQYTPQQMHGGNFKSISDIKRMKNSGRNSKLIELTTSPVRTMHGGNLKFDNNKKRGGRRNEKLIEFDDEHDDDRHSSQDDDYKTSPHNTRTDRLHGGNYRSAKLIAAKEREINDMRARNSDREARKNAAAILNSYAQAVPVLTTTPAYILDPSKRMYYYVEA